MKGEERYWWVVKGLEENDPSSHLQSIVDYLLEIRPLESYHASITLSRENVFMGDALDTTDAEKDDRF